MVVMFRIGKSNRESALVGCWEILLMRCRYPPILYTRDGEDIKERLWQETMEELSFAGAAKIVEEMRR